MYKLYKALGLAGLMMTQAVSAQDASSPDYSTPNISGHNKTAIIADKRLKAGWYDSEFQFSPAVRAGDTLYFSGVVATANGSDAPLDRDGYKERIKRAMNIIGKILEAGGADWNSVVKIRTFHVFDSPYLNLSKPEQIKVIAEVKDDLMDEPHSAWTAIGISSLFDDTGLVEIEVIAYAPDKEKSGT
ncbi:hypothetical protein GCM10017044_15750 [Kordiimonas sediminis]|uniref:RidA family protein n=1 Tax=Kordiimonas sediminis TaxID=1735581 RepID=A0A919AS80_9PROT|nr:Rid family hydrolase [Kordiimonas sediminis]GHF22400.1 hypothetical protein GCM10017044_15750 [Kordiimonas sediminis]